MTESFLDYEIDWSPEVGMANGELNVDHCSCVDGDGIRTTLQLRSL